MEIDPLKPKAPESEPGDKEKKRKRRKRKFAAPIPVETDVKRTDDRPTKVERSAFDEVLAELAVERQEQAETPNESADEAMSETTDDTEPADNSEAYEDYQPLPEYEPEPAEFSGGEVVIHLQGNKPVAERVVPLHTEAVVESAAVPLPKKSEPIHQPVPGSPQIQSSSELPVNPGPTIPLAEIRPGPDYAESSVADAYPPSANAMDTLPQALAEPASKQDLEDALYRATRTGEHRGALTGLVVGGAYEHLKHKRREKRADRRFQEQTKQLAAARESEHFFFAEQAQRNAEHGRQLAAAEQRLGTVVGKPEKLPVKAAEAELVEVPERELTVPAGHRLETSAWHTIEVDSKTGKPVEVPAFAYGHEYYHERAAENTPIQQRNAAAGEVALVAAAVADDGGMHTPTVPPIPDASTQGSPSKHPKRASDSQTRSATATLHKSSTTTDTTPLWPWVVTLVVIVVVLILLLH